MRAYRILNVLLIITLGFSFFIYTQNIKLIEKNIDELNMKVIIVEKEVRELEQKIAERNEEKVLEKVDPSRGENRGIMLLATAYTTSADECGNDLGITATGTKAEPFKTLAVDPSVIPLGSLVYVFCNSYPSVNGYYIAEDTGGAIKGKKADICFDTKSKSRDFGRRWIEVTVITKK